MIEPPNIKITLARKSLDAITARMSRSRTPGGTRREVVLAEGEPGEKPITNEAASATIPCPFVYANGKKCGGKVIRIEAYKADIWWAIADDGEWRFNWGEPRSYYHLFCSEKGNHALFKRPSRLTFFYRDLPAPLRLIISK